jgi:hypothetical protein
MSTLQQNWRKGQTGSAWKQGGEGEGREGEGGGDKGEKWPKQ